MLERLIENLEMCLEEGAAFLWRMFEKDMALTEAVIARTESLCAALFRRPAK